MNKSEFVEALAKETESTKADALVYTNAFLRVLEYALASGDSVSFVGFGTFDVRSRDERAGHNPRTGEDIVIPAQKNVHFKAGKPLKEAVNIG